MVMSSSVTLNLLAHEGEVTNVLATADISLGKYNTASQEFIFFREPIKSNDGADQSKI